MKTWLSQRTTYFIGFLIIAVLLSLSLYLELVDGMTPCPLCILQRICLGSLGAVFLLGALVNFKKIGRFFINIVALLLATGGALLAGRQAWLQHNPLVGENCDVSLQYMIRVMPLDEVVKKIFTGGTECSQVNWQFLHFSLAEWSLVCFSGFIVFIIWQLLRQK